MEHMFISGYGVQSPQRPLTKTNQQGKQRLILVINAAMEAEKKIRMIKAVVKPEIGSLHPRKFIDMICGNPSIQMAALGSRF